MVVSEGLLRSICSSLFFKNVEDPSILLTHVTFYLSSIGIFLPLVTRTMAPRAEDDPSNLNTSVQHAWTQQNSYSKEHTHKKTN